MIRSHGLKAVGLCVMMALSLMAFAASAQAEPGANWMVNGSNISATLLPKVEVKEIENKTAILLFTTGGGTSVAILCTTAQTKGVNLKSEGSVSEGSVRFSGCLTKLNGTTSAPCEPHTGTENGIVETKNGVGLLVLVGGVPVTLLKPAAGTELAKIELSEECSIGESVPVTGELTLKDCNNEESVEKLEHLVEQGPGTSLTALGQPATLDGSAFLQLGGAHVGLKFSGLPA